MSDIDITSAIVLINGSSGKNCHYDANRICKLLGISNYLTAISGLTLGLEKVMHLRDDGETFALTKTGVRKLVDGLEEGAREKVDAKILRHFDYDTDNGLAKSKHAAEKAAAEKPLEKNLLVGFLRTVYPERKIMTNWVVPTTERSLDIYIPGVNGKDSIAIICDAARQEPLQITQEETQTAFNLKATTQRTLQWVLFKDYCAKRPTESFFRLISEINTILYGPFGPPPEKKTRKPRVKKTESKKELPKKKDSKGKSKKQSD